MKNRVFCTALKGGFAQFSLSDTPLLIRDPQDPSSEAHRRNCLAWHLLSTRTRAQILEWLSKQPVALRGDMRARLNRLREQFKEQRRESAHP
ncbi:hypothetical protein [uncultured Microbulbifer sp.]|uniref:hypothetical protein n=1 Tax=uncultured Microbulbifer sp. TaxID=348147 RepID=UPI00260836C7|nr:hypothetical protein [uncultured Microbulbifer sp.]